MIKIPTTLLEHKKYTKQFDDKKRLNICGLKPSLFGTPDSGSWTDS
jgi:hypothetical protein